MARMNSRNIMKILLKVNFILFFYFAFILINFADSGNFDNNKNNFLFGFSGFVQYGYSHGTAIAPENGNIDNINSPYEMGYGFSAHILYKLNNEWKTFLEIGYSDRRILCARENENGIGSWIADMTGNTLNNSYGPFDSNIYFYMNTFIIKPGVKYYVLDNDNFKPWVGTGISIYPWNAAYMNADKTRTYSSTKGICFYIDLLYFGFDMNIDIGEKETIIFSLYANLGAPAVKMRFDNLFQDGWTYINDTGEEVISPYKFGIIMLFEI